MDRDTCWDCHRFRPLCFCSSIVPFEIEPIIALLIHPKEFQRTVGTARVVKLSIRNSLAWTGYGPDFDTHPEILKFIADPHYFPVILYPGPDSLNLSQAQSSDLESFFPKGRIPMIFVIDGTWANAKRMIRLSTLLSSLPKISFNVRETSKYIFRKQPKTFCLSTVEAVHELIENMQEQKLCQVRPDGAHASFLQVFTKLVEGQLAAQVEFRKPRFVP